MNPTILLLCAVVVFIGCIAIVVVAGSAIAEDGDFFAGRSVGSAIFAGLALPGAFLGGRALVQLTRRRRRA